MVTVHVKLTGKPQDLVHILVRLREDCAGAVLTMEDTAAKATGAPKYANDLRDSAASFNNMISEINAAIAYADSEIVR